MRNFRADWLEIRRKTIEVINFFCRAISFLLNTEELHHRFSSVQTGIIDYLCAEREDDWRRNRKSTEKALNDFLALHIKPFLEYLLVLFLAFCFPKHACTQLQSDSLWGVSTSSLWALLIPRIRSAPRSKFNKRRRLKMLFCFCWKSLFAFNLNLWCNIFLWVFNQAGLVLKREYHSTIFFPSITFPVFLFAADDDETFLLWWCTLRRNYRKPKIEPQQSVVQCAEERTFCEIYDMLVAITDCCRRTANSRYFYR